MAAPVAILTIEERVTVPNTAFTHAGYRSWVTSDVYPEKGLRTTFVNGEVLVDMTPEFIEGHIKVKGAVGSPDLVVEIVSKTSVKKDTILLRQADALAGVREYWLIDARGDSMRFEILHNEDGELRSSGDAGAPQESRVLAGRWQLTRSRNRVGRFSYELTRVLSEPLKEGQ